MSITSLVSLVVFLIPITTISGLGRFSCMNIMNYYIMECIQYAGISLSIVNQ